MVLFRRAGESQVALGIDLGTARCEEIWWLYMQAESEPQH